MSGKATRIELFQWRTPQMRAFHLSWLAFFVCFFAWFAVAPLMPLLREDLRLSSDQVANVSIAAVAMTILGRLLVGPLCDRLGPRRTYAGLLLLGSIPVFGMMVDNNGFRYADATSYRERFTNLHNKCFLYTSHLRC